MNPIIAWWKQFWELEPVDDMFGRYSAELDEQARVVRVIVGQPDWAADNLDGAWVSSDSKVGLGWVWDGYEFVVPDSEGTDEPLVYGNF
jgi:hypothetical protein